MSTTSSISSAINHRIDPSAAGKKQSLVDQHLLQAITNSQDETALRARLIQLTMAQPGAAGVCFLKKNIQDQWGLLPRSPKAGRMPRGEEFLQTVSETCDAVAQSRNIQTEPIPESKGCTLLAPVRPRSGEAEIMLVTMATQKNALLATPVIQKIVAALTLWLDKQSAADSDWQVMALASVIELVGKIEKQNNHKAAAEETVNLLANRLKCNSVAIGIGNNRRMKLQAISGISKIDHGSETSRNYLQTMVESATRQQPGIHPTTDLENNHVLQAHKQLASGIHAGAVFSQPLFTENQDFFGAIVFTGPRSLIDSDQVQRFANAAAPAITSALEVVGKVRQNFVRRCFSWISSQLAKTKVLLGLAGVVGVVLMMFVPTTYRVRCNCTAEPVSRRFAFAPFDGQIIVGHVEAGDFVNADQVLAEMDGRAINWELAGVIAERKQSIRTREMELAERNVAKTMLSELEHERLASEESVLNYKKEHLLVKSPIDGVVLSGSLERAEAASVQTGETLFEIGPLKPIRIEIAVPDDEIAQVGTGYPVKVWIDGQEDEPITGKILKIHPRSETRDADNVFVAEVEFPNDDERLRPGMKGSARIDCQQRSLGWSLFHKPLNWVRSRLTWW